MPAQRHQQEEFGLVETLGLLTLGMLMSLPRLALFGFAIVDSGLIRGAFDGWVAGACGLPRAALDRAGVRVDVEHLLERRVGLGMGGRRLRIPARHLGLVGIPAAVGRR